MTATAACVDAKIRTPLAAWPASGWRGRLLFYGRPMGATHFQSWCTSGPTKPSPAHCLIHGADQTYSVGVEQHFGCSPVQGGPYNRYVLGPTSIFVSKHVPCQAEYHINVSFTKNVPGQAENQKRIFYMGRKKRIYTRSGYCLNRVKFDLARPTGQR